MCTSSLLQYCIRRGLNRIMGAMIEHPLRMPLSSVIFHLIGPRCERIIRFYCCCVVSHDSNSALLFYKFFVSHFLAKFFHHIFLVFVVFTRIFITSLLKCFGVFVLYRVKNVVTRSYRDMLLVVSLYYVILIWRVIKAHIVPSWWAKIMIYCGR